MIGIHGSLRIDAEKHWDWSRRRVEFWSTQDMAHACGEALGSEEEMLND